MSVCDSCEPMLKFFPVHCGWESRFWTENNWGCRTLQMLAPHSRQEQKIRASTTHCSNNKHKVKVSVYPIICSANNSAKRAKMPLKSLNEEVLLFALWMWKCDFHAVVSGAVRAVECVTQLSHLSIRPSFLVMSKCLLSEPRSLSVSAREARSPLLPWVLLNARTRSIRDSGLQRL